MRKSLPYSKFALIFIILILAYNVFLFVPHSILSWDIFGYYLYLPLQFIYHDLGIKDITIIDKIIDKYHNTSTFYQALHLPNGNWVMKYPMGMAVLYSPFFAIGHLVASLAGFEKDGFSVPYQLSLLYGSFLYTLLGLYFLRKSLLKLFDEITTATLLIIIVLGTNSLIHLSIHGQGLMSHNYLFFLFALILWLTLKWHETHEQKFTFGLGIAIGLAALSRPTELLVVLIPLLWNISGFRLSERFYHLLHYSKQYLLMLGLVAIIGSIQLIYWKLMTGKFLFNSYGGNAGEGMEFFHPFLVEVLFSFRKGWLLYTPLMTLSLIGFYPLYYKNRTIFPAILLFFLLSFYVIASWTCWWYADCYSQRALIPMYVFLAIPMGYAIKKLNEFKKYLRLINYLFIFILLMFNVFQTWQYLNGLIHPTRMTRSAYESTLFKTKIPSGFNKMLLVDRNTDPEKLIHEGNFTSRQIDFQDFENSGSQISDNFYESKAFVLSTEQPFSPKFEIAFKDLTKHYFAIVLLEADLLNTADPNQNPVLLGMNLEHNEYAYYERITTFDAKNSKAKGWSKVKMYYLTPEVRRPEDRFQTNFYLKGNQPVYLDNIKIILFEPLEKD